MLIFNKLAQRPIISTINSFEPEILFNEEGYMLKIDGDSPSVSVGEGKNWKFSASVINSVL